MKLEEHFLYTNDPHHLSPQISGSAVQKLEDQAYHGGSIPPADAGQSGQLYAAPLESLTLRKRHQSELNRLDSSWKRRMQEYEDQNKYLFLMTSKRLQDDLSKIEENYTGKNKYQPVCPTVENEVEVCYRNNAKNPLKCSKQVKSFVSCIQDARFKSLLRS